VGKIPTNQGNIQEKLETLLGKALLDDGIYTAITTLVQTNLESTIVLLDANPQDNEVRKLLGERRAYNQILSQLDALRNRAQLQQ
jgi:hypothetical protein